MKVDLLVIGAGRSGTTTVCSYLESHPQVCFSSIKEVHYFSIPDLNERGEKYYHSFFTSTPETKIFASADTYLMMDYEAIQRIHRYNPNMKIVVMLRDPIQRAYSSYNYSVNYGYHDALGTFADCEDFEKGIENEKDIVQRNNLGHLYAGLYHKHLKEWLKVFSPDNFLLLKTTDLKMDPEKLYRQLCAFGGLEYKPIVDEGAKKNQNAVPRNKMLEQFLLNRNNGLRQVIRKWTPGFVKKALINSKVVDKIHEMNRVTSDYKPLSQEEYDQLIPYFKEDADRLKEQFGVDVFSS